MRMRQHILIALAAMSIAACTKQTPDPSPQGPDSPRSYIFFEPSVNKSVDAKAALIEGESLPADAGTAFGVLGYYGGISLFSSAHSSYNGIARVYRPEGSTETNRLPFQYDNLIYWHHPTANHKFYAYYPYGLSAVPNNGHPYITYTQPTSNDANMVDLMTAYTSTPKCSLVELTFYHRLWALDVVITNAQTEGLNASNQVINTPTLTIKSVSVIVEDFPTGATVYLDKDYKENEADNTPGIALNSATASQPSTYTLTPAGTEDTLNNSGTTSSKQYGSCLFLPVSSGVFKYKLNITYLDSRGVECAFPTALKTVNKAFEAGKRYKLTVTKTNDTFVVGTLSPSDWTDQNVNHEFN